MSATLFGAICAVLEFIVLLFSAISIGTDTIRAKTVVKPAKRDCFSLWGAKTCGPHKANPSHLPNRGFPAPAGRIEAIANCSIAFDIISAVVALVAFILFILATCKCVSMMIPFILTIANTIFLIIAFGCMAGIWYLHSETLGGARIHKYFSLAYGAILCLTAWCLQVVTLILAFIAVFCCNNGGSDNGNEPVKNDDEESV